MGKYRVIRHHEQLVDASDEEEARSVAMRGPYTSTVEPLDTEALEQYRNKLYARSVRQRQDLIATEHDIREIDKELNGSA